MKLPFIRKFNGRIIWVYIRRFLCLIGLISLFSIAFSFTDYPFWAYYWLGTHNTELENDPDILILLGGGGMPSPDGLLRCYFTADIANLYPDSKVIIAIPGDTALKEKSPDLMMRDELVLRGVDSSRIAFENRGINTRSQAINISNMLNKQSFDSLSFRLVTTPEHMYRSVATFRKIGFRYVGGKPAFGKDLNAELLIQDRESTGESKKSIRALNLRYNMWSYLKYEITVMRELCAIIYYKMRGWI